MKSWYHRFVERLTTVTVTESPPRKLRAYEVFTIAGTLLGIVAFLSLYWLYQANHATIVQLTHEWAPFWMALSAGYGLLFGVLRSMEAVLIAKYGRKVKLADAASQGELPYDTKDATKC